MHKPHLTAHHKAPPLRPKRRNRKIAWNEILASGAAYLIWMYLKEPFVVGRPLCKLKINTNSTIFPVCLLLICFSFFFFQSWNGLHGPNARQLAGKEASKWGFWDVKINTPLETDISQRITASEAVNTNLKRKQDHVVIYHHVTRNPDGFPSSK